MIVRQLARLLESVVPNGYAPTRVLRTTQPLVAGLPARHGGLTLRHRDCMSYESRRLQYRGNVMDATQMVGGRMSPGTLRAYAEAAGAHEAMRLPLAYAGYVGLSALDGIGTGLILWLGGTEVNPIADAVLSRFGFPGMITFKFALVVLVIVICEHIVRQRPRTAKGVMAIAIAVSLVPVAIAILECTCHLLSPG